MLGLCSSSASLITKKGTTDMKLKELVHWDQSGGGGSPAFWVDEESGEFYFQGYKVSDEVLSRTSCPSHEGLVRVPASFWEQLKDFARKSS